MKLSVISQPLVEMGKPAQVCDLCGHSPMHKTHNYNAGTRSWKCKASLGVLPGYPKAGATASSAAAPQASSAPSGSVPPAAPPSAPRIIAPAGPAGPSVSVRPVAKASARVAATPSASSWEDQVTNFLSEKGVSKEQFKFNGDNTVSIEADDVDFSDLLLRKVPMKITEIKGDFHLGGMFIESLQNCPDTITGDFDCTHCEKLTSLTGGPREVGGDYAISNNSNLSSLEGVAQKIGGDFNCSRNSKLTSLKGIHKMIKQVNGEMNFADSGVKENVLGLLVISGVTSIKLPDAKVTEIMNKHLKSEDRDINACQEDLINAGFPAFAKP